MLQYPLAGIYPLISCWCSNTFWRVSIPWSVADAPIPFGRCLSPDQLMMSSDNTHQVVFCLLKIVRFMTTSTQTMSTSLHTMSLHSTHSIEPLNFVFVFWLKWLHFFIFVIISPLPLLILIQHYLFIPVLLIQRQSFILKFSFFRLYHNIRFPICHIASATSWILTFYFICRLISTDLIQLLCDLVYKI